MSSVNKPIVLIVAGVTAAASCKVATYGYQYRITQEFTGGEEPETPNVEARQLLAGARTVAFYPPDNCINAEHAKIEEHETQELHASCGVMLSTLERAAESAGYEVVSWQNLKGERRAIEYAREAKVDVLFEINEFEPHGISDSDIQRTLTFFDESEGGSDAPLNVSNAQALQCKQFADTRDPPRPVALTGTLDIKAVSVADGRARWHYRKTLAQQLGGTYPKVMFRAPEQPSTASQVLFGVGLGLVITGGTLGLLEAATGSGTGSGDTGFDSKGWSTNLVVLGGVALVGGLVAQIALGGQKPEPEKVLCNQMFVVNDVVMPVAQPVGPVSSEHTFNETSRHDPLQRQREQVRGQLIDQFIGMLKDAHPHSLPPPPPALTPPAPAPAPAPTPTP